MNEQLKLLNDYQNLDKENKKLVKQNVISKITGGAVGFALSGLAWLFWFYLNNK